MGSGGKCGVQRWSVVVGPVGSGGRHGGRGGQLVVNWWARWAISGKLMSDGGQRWSMALLIIRRNV